MDELYKRYSRLVFSYLKSLCGDSEIAEELTQETFYNAIKGVKNFKGESKVSNWLCKIAKNVWIDYLKKEKKIDVISYDSEDFYIKSLQFETNIENNIENRNDLISLYKGIHKLDDITKEVVLLRIRGEFSFKEIAEIFEKSEEWARIIFYRGKIRLKEDLKND